MHFDHVLSFCTSLYQSPCFLAYLTTPLSSVYYLPYPPLRVPTKEGFIKHHWPKPISLVWWDFPYEPAFIAYEI